MINHDTQMSAERGYLHTTTSSLQANDVQFRQKSIPIQFLFRLLSFNSIPIPIPPLKLLAQFNSNSNSIPEKMAQFNYNSIMQFYPSIQFRFQFRFKFWPSIQFWFQVRRLWKPLKSDSNSNSGIGIAHHCYRHSQCNQNYYTSDSL